MYRKLARLFVNYSIFAALLCGTAKIGAEALLIEAAQWRKSPVTDDRGRTSYIVDLRPDARRAFPETEKSENTARFHHRHLPQFVNMIVAFEDRYGFETREQTSWVGDSFVATLTPEQLRAVRADSAVAMVTEETYM